MKEIKVPKVGYMTLKGCSWNLPVAADIDDDRIWIFDYDPVQDIIFTWTMEDL
jgi:hypothetical protein